MIYQIAKGLFVLYFNVLFRYKVYGKEHIPKEGGCIVCSNHISNWDPVLVAASLNRKIHYMGKEELFTNPFLSWLFKQLGAFPVNRESVSMKTLKETIHMLNEGKIMGIFAQGTRMKEEDINGAKSGVALFALKSGVPVVPVGIKGKYKPFSKIEVYIGEPLALDEYRAQKLRSDVLKSATDEIMESVGACLKKLG